MGEDHGLSNVGLERRGLGRRANGGRVVLAPSGGGRVNCVQIDRQGWVSRTLGKGPIQGLEYGCTYRGRRWAGQRQVGAGRIKWAKRRCLLLGRNFDK